MPERAVHTFVDETGVPGMGDCANIARCRFFKGVLAEMPAMADLYKKNYCSGDFARCARFMVSSKLGPADVPPDLWPNQVEEARRILEEHGAA